MSRKNEGYMGRRKPSGWKKMKRFDRAKELALELHELKRIGADYKKYNFNMHIKITKNENLFEYWPTTGKYLANGVYGYGFLRLLDIVKGS